MTERPWGGDRLIVSRAGDGNDAGPERYGFVIEMLSTLTSVNTPAFVSS
jgi:hypothetical protein